MTMDRVEEASGDSGLGKRSGLAGPPPHQGGTKAEKPVKKGEKMAGIPYKKDIFLAITTKF